ncbi:MAG: S41 family peptidase [Phycisphaerae bacterium]
MNRNGLFIRWAFIVAVLLSFTSVAWAQNASTAEVDGGFSESFEAGKLWRDGVARAKAGDFSTALEKIRAAAEKDPDDEYIAAGKECLDEYLSRRERFESQRRREYSDAVRRVRRGILAQKYLPKLVAADLHEPLSTKVEEDIVERHNSVDGASTLSELSEEEAELLRSDVLDAAGHMSRGLEEAVALLEGDNSEYAQQFPEVVEDVDYYVRVYRNGWEGVRLESEQDRAKAADALGEVEEKLSENLSELEIMVAEKPWRRALSQGILARELHRSGNGELSEKDWYNELIALGEKHAEQAVADAEWYDAAAAYSGLEDLTGGNGRYEQKVRQARRHVRVLGLYGEDDPDSETRPARNMSWRDLAEGADANMVRDAIQRLDQYYVEKVEYRELAKGALLAMEVLANTPQAAESFETLDDDSKRKKFLNAVKSMKENIDRKQQVGSLDLLFMLNHVLRESERSVKLPAEVIAVEFADGMLNELDKFSSMIWPQDLADFEKHTRGHFFGVGIQITKEIGEPLEVVTPLAGTPAYRAGIKPGDVIIAVDGRRTEDLGIDKLVRMIMGEEGTRVTLKIERPGRVKPFDVTVKREKITIRTVKGWRRVNDESWRYQVGQSDGVGYVRCSQFSEQTSEELIEALEQIDTSELDALVLDLRWNAGGLLSSAVEVSDEFLNDHRRIVSTKGRQARYEERSAGPDGRYLNKPLVVLVNDASASAAEIVAGALQDWDRAIVVGERTYGKGSVQHVIRIRPERAMLKLTTAYYYLPHGRLLHRANGKDEWGVEPDIEVLMTPEQTRRWLELRRESDLIQDIEPEELGRELSKQYDADLQLQTAVVLLKLMRLDEQRSAA